MTQANTQKVPSLGNSSPISSLLDSQEDNPLSLSTQQWKEFTSHIMNERQAHENTELANKLFGTGPSFSIGAFINNVA